MLDYRHHDEGDLSLSSRELSLDGPRDVRLGSASSHTSVDSALRMTKPVSTPASKRSPPNADEDSDCDSDASGEYEPLRASTSRLQARTISPPPPLPPPRPRCNSLHSVLPSSHHSPSPAAAHFSAPPETSCSLDNLHAAPAAQQTSSASRMSLSRFLGMHRPAQPRRFTLLWRRKTERVTRAEVAVDPSVLLNKSLPNLSGTPPVAAGAGTVVGTARVSSIAGTPRSVSPSRRRISAGALHRALKLVQERTLRKGRARKDQMCDNSKAVVSVSAVTGRGTAGEREAASSLAGFMETLSAEVSPAVRKQECLVNEIRRVSFESAHFQFPGDVLTESRSAEQLDATARTTSPVYELIGELPSIVIDRPEDAQEKKVDQDRLGNDSPDRQDPDDDEGYVTMDAMQAILRSSPSYPLLNVPDDDPATSYGDPEPGYLDMAEISRLRRSFDASSTSSPAKTAPPVRPPRRARDAKLISPRDSSKAEADYDNLSDLHRALQELQGAGGPAITEDE